MKKILVTLMAVILAVSVTACGGSADTSDSTNDAVQTEQ